MLYARTILLALFTLVWVSAAAVGQDAAEAPAPAVSDQYRSFAAELVRLQPLFDQALLRPHSISAPESRSQVREMINRAMILPEDPLVPAAYMCLKHRYLAMLKLILVAQYELTARPTDGRPLALEAYHHTQQAKVYLLSALDHASIDYSETFAQWASYNYLGDAVKLLEAISLAYLGDEEQAQNVYTQIAPDYRRQNEPMTPQLRRLLGLDTLRNPSVPLITTFGVSLAIMLICLAMVVCIPHPTESQDRVFRIILSMSSAGVVAGIPGVLQVSLPNGITATGAFAVLIIVYFFNPARLVTKAGQSIRRAVAAGSQPA